jgi:hypothetical protein
MIEGLKKNRPSKKVIYPFRFLNTNKLVRLNEKQLNCIPYLSSLVAHKDDFLSVQNENGEYILHPPIHYTWFMAILPSIISKEPYILINELSEHDNILGTLQLFDYLGLGSFPFPLFEGKHLILSNGTSNDTHVEYHRANLVETRTTAAEFIIALSKNAYNLVEYGAVDDIISLITVILSNPTVYSSRFRHHTLRIAKECCWIFFSKNQQLRLHNTHQKMQKHRKLNSLMYLYDDKNSLPEDFVNAFSRRGVYKPLEENYINGSTERMIHYRDASVVSYRRPLLEQLNVYFLEEILLYINLYSSPFTTEQIEMQRKKEEAHSARSGCFNKFPKRPNIDKFKHPSGRKPLKYR